MSKAGWVPHKQLSMEDIHTSGKFFLRSLSKPQDFFSNFTLTVK